MLYSLILEYVDQYTFLNVFKYLTFRTGLAMFTSLVVVLLIGTPFINFFSKRKILDPIREDGPSEHIVKKIGTPTMGGVLILTGLFLEFFYGEIYRATTFGSYFLLLPVLVFLGPMMTIKRLNLKIRQVSHLNLKLFHKY